MAIFENNPMEPIPVTLCPVCDSPKYRPRYPSRGCPEAGSGLEGGIPGAAHYPIVECVECGVVYTRLRAPEEVLKRIYASSRFSDYLSEMGAKEKMFARQLDYIERRLPQRGRMLEIGCAAGLFIRLAAGRGWEAIGCDSWEEAVTYGRRCWDIDLRPLPAERIGEIEGEFDAIVLWDVIEHLSRPGELLSLVRDKLKPGGILALSTPDYGSWSRRLLGSRWHFFETTHLVFFRRKILAKLLEKLGFRVLAVRGQIKFVSGAYLARYLGKWSRVLSLFVRRLVAATGIADLLFHLPSGMMIAYARKIREEDSIQ